MNNKERAEKVINSEAEQITKFVTGTPYLEYKGIKEDLIKAVTQALDDAVEDAIEDNLGELGEIKEYRAMLKETAENIKLWGEQAVADMRERCAKVADAYQRDYLEEYSPELIAKAIRKLK